MHGLFRTAMKDVELGGTHVPKGAQLCVMYASANDDDTHFDHPRELDIQRPNVGTSLTFGSGIHKCVGLSLARMEIKVAAQEIIRRLDNIELSIDLPVGWTRTVEPRMVQSLEINEETRVRLSFTPPEDVAVGKYQVRIRTSGLSNTEPVTAEDKTVTVEIKAETSLIGTLTIVILLVGLVAGIVVFGVRLSRK